VDDFKLPSDVCVLYNAEGKKGTTCRRCDLLNVRSVLQQRYWSLMTAHTAGLACWYWTALTTDHSNQFHSVPGDAKLNYHKQVYYIWYENNVSRVAARHALLLGSAIGRTRAVEPVSRDFRTRAWDDTPTRSTNCALENAFGCYSSNGSSTEMQTAHMLTVHTPSTLASALHRPE
jgi:hypothetical protein